MSHPKRRDGPDGVGATVLDQRSRDDLQCVGHRLVRPLMNALDQLGFLLQRLLLKTSSRMQTLATAVYDDTVYSFL